MNPPIGQSAWRAEESNYLTHDWDSGTAPISLSHLRDRAGARSALNMLQCRISAEAASLAGTVLLEWGAAARGEPTCASHPFPTAWSENKLSRSPASNRSQLSRCDWGATISLMWQGRTRWAVGLQRGFRVVEKKNTTITSWLSVEGKRGWLRATSIVRPLNIILPISHDHTPDVFRARWAFIRSGSTRGKYCTWLGKYSFRVLMLDSSSISVWGNYYICLAAQITRECSNFTKHMMHLWNTTGRTIAIQVISIVFCDGKNE